MLLAAETMPLAAETTPLTNVPQAESREHLELLEMFWLAAHSCALAAWYPLVATEDHIAMAWAAAALGTATIAVVAPIRRVAGHYQRFVRPLEASLHLLVTALLCYGITVVIDERFAWYVCFTMCAQIVYTVVRLYECGISVSKRGPGVPWHDLCVRTVVIVTMVVLGRSIAHVRSLMWLLIAANTVACIYLLAHSINTRVRLTIIAAITMVTVCILSVCAYTRQHEEMCHQRCIVCSCIGIPCWKMELLYIGNALTFITLACFHGS